MHSVGCIQWDCVSLVAPWTVHSSSLLHPPTWPEYRKCPVGGLNPQWGDYPPDIHSSLDVREG